MIWNRFVLSVLIQHFGNPAIKLELNVLMEANITVQCLLYVGLYLVVRYASASFVLCDMLFSIHR